MIQFSINSVSVKDKLSSSNVAVTHTYAGEIKRTLTGKVSSFPTSFRTVGLSVIFIGDIVDLVSILNMIQVDKVTLDFTDTVYTCSAGKFSCTDAKIERLRDKGDKKGQLTANFVTIGIPVLTPSQGMVVISAPDNQ